ncbi:MAG: hypothetical protein AABZ14_04810, partial [Candidatus Margulisiibacteriota bacterium]
ASEPYTYLNPKLLRDFSGNFHLDDETKGRNAKLFKEQIDALLITPITENVYSPSQQAVQAKGHAPSRLMHLYKYFVTAGETTISLSGNVVPSEFTKFFKAFPDLRAKISFESTTAGFFGFGGKKVTGFTIQGTLTSGQFLELKKCFDSPKDKEKLNALEVKP